MTLGSLGAKLQYVQAFQARETTWVAYVLCQPAHSAWLYDGTAATKSLTFGSRFEFLSPFYDGTHGWEGGARESGAPRSLTPAGNLIVAGGSELRVSDRVV